MKTMRNHKYQIRNLFTQLTLTLVLVGCDLDSSVPSYKIELKDYFPDLPISECITKFGYDDGHQLYFELLISNNDKKKLLKMFLFKDHLSALKSKYPPDYLIENINFAYSIKSKGLGPYGYLIFALEKEGNQFLIYMFYGE